MASEKRIMPCGGTFRSCDGECWKCGESKAKTDVKTESDDTIYGYKIEHLAMIARVLQKEGLPPERVAESLNDIGRIVAIVKNEFEETLRKAVEQCTTL